MVILAILSVLAAIAGIVLVVCELSFMRMILIWLQNHLFAVMDEKIMLSRTLPNGTMTVSRGGIAGKLPDEE